jgi:hypothetical protein
MPRRAPIVDQRRRAKLLQLHPRPARFRVLAPTLLEAIRQHCAQERADLHRDERQQHHEREVGSREDEQTNETDQELYSDEGS